MTERIDPRFDPRFQPGFEPEPESGSTAEDTQEPPAGDCDAEPNPFERTLGVVAVLLVVGGVALAFSANSLNYFGTGDAWNWKEIFQSSGWALSSPMVTVGLGTGVGLLFRRAISWKPPQ